MFHDHRNHRKYFMQKEFYEIPKIGATKKEPFNALSGSEWLEIVQHVFAHTVKSEPLLGSSELKYRPSRENFLDLLGHTRKYYSEEKILVWCLTKYLRENEGLDGPKTRVVPIPEYVGNIPENEYDLFKKSARLYNELAENHSDSVGGFL